MAPIAEPAPRWVESAAAVLRHLEHQWRCAYVRYVPRSVLACVDGPLRALVGGVRRSVSIGFYVSQPLGTWSGLCTGRPATVTMWGRPRDLQPLVHLLFDGEPSVRWHGRCSYANALRLAAAVPAHAEMLVAATTPALAGAFRRRACFIVPGTLRLGGRPETLSRIQRSAPESLRSDLRLVRRSAYRLEVRPYRRSDSVRFYERYIVPHARARFGAAAWVPAFDWIDRSFASGFAILAWRPGADDPDAVLIGVPRNDLLWIAHVGTLDADPAVLHRGGIAALYGFAIRVAQTRAVRFLDMGRSRPWLTDGVTRYKWKWGFRPFVDLGEPLEWAISVRHPDGAATRRFLESQPIGRVGTRFSMISPQGGLTSDSLNAW